MRPAIRNAAHLAFTTALAVGPVAARDLTFEERVQAQAAIERVRHVHRIGVDRPFEERVSRPLLEAKVRDYLRKSVALESWWSTAVTAEMLEREATRMARGTRAPDRLEELFAALGDGFLVQETLARATLVDRLSRNRFAADERIHGAAPGR